MSMLTKLNHILEIYRKAPSNYKTNAEHLSSLATLFPYIYHTALVKKYLKDTSSKILDWGAYLGQVTYLLQDQFTVNSYNPSSPQEVLYWQKNLGIKLVSEDKGYKDQQLNFPKESFEAVISSGVLEHSFEHGVDDVTALRNLNSVLKPNGLLFIWNLPTKNALAEKVAEKRKKWRHILRYELDEILVKLSLAGFNVVSIERQELIFNQLAKILKLVPLPWIWSFDHFLCNLPLLNNFAHHYTIVAKKIENFPVVPATSSYTAYPKS